MTRIANPYLPKSRPAGLFVEIGLHLTFLQQTREEMCSKVDAIGGRVQAGKVYDNEAVYLITPEVRQLNAA